MHWLKRIRRIIERDNGTDLVNTYQRVRPSIVAFTEKYSVLTDAQLRDKRFTSFPPILGTGFVVDPAGIIVTNDHIAAVLAASKTSLFSQNGECTYLATFFRDTDNGLIQIPIEILCVYQPKGYPRKVNYGPQKPDVALVLVKARGLPSLELDTKTMREGVEVATAGYPMGTTALTAPGYLHQITPTLQRGIISAVLPFWQQYPHAYALNVMVQGGASGSPVFLPRNGRVVGIIDRSLNDLAQASIPKQDADQGHQGIIYQKPTTISYATPSYDILGFLREVKDCDALQLPPDTLTLDELIMQREGVMVLPGDSPGRLVRNLGPEPNDQRTSGE